MRDDVLRDAVPAFSLCFHSPCRRGRRQSPDADVTSAFPGVPTRRRRSQGGFALLGLDHGHALGSRQRPTFTGLR